MLELRNFNLMTVVKMVLKIKFKEPSFPKTNK